MPAGEAPHRFGHLVEEKQHPRRHGYRPDRAQQLVRIPPMGLPAPVDGSPEAKHPEEEDAVPDRDPVSPPDDHPVSSSHRVRRTARTGAVTAKPVKRENPGSVAVAPAHPESVGAHQPELERADVVWNRSRVEQPASAHLLHALGAGAGEPERPRREEGPVPRAIPVDQYAVVAPRDAQRERIRHCAPPFLPSRPAVLVVYVTAPGAPRDFHRSRPPWRAPPPPPPPTPSAPPASSRSMGGGR